MFKKLKADGTYPIWIIFFFIIISPISLSYKNLNDYSFSVVGGTFDYISTGYLFTLPISFFFIIPFVILGLRHFKKDLDIFLFSLFILFTCIFSFVFIKDLSYFVLIAKIITPIFLLLGFEMYFKKKFLNIKKKNFLKIINNSNRKIALALIIVFFISIINPIYLENKFYWLTDKIAIYDFFQYYPLIFILLLGVLASNNQRYIILLIYLFCFYLSTWSSNLTFYFLLILYGFYHIFSFLIARKLKNQVILSKIVLYLVLIFFIFYPVIVATFFSEFFNMKIFLGNASITSRLNAIYSFFINMSILDFITPFRLDTKISSKFYHNELVVLLSTLGIFGTFLFFKIFFKRIFYISKYFPQISIAISFVAFLSGIILTPILHPYTSFILCYIISYYFVISKLRSE